MATTYYLDTVNGSDSNSGLSTSLPKKTMAAMQTLYTAGSLNALYIRTGSTVTTALVLSTTGGITIGMYGTGPNPVWDGGGSGVGTPVTISGVGGIAISDIDMQNGISAIRVSGASDGNNFARMKLTTFSDSIIFYLTGTSGTAHTASDIYMDGGLNDGYSIFGNGVHTLRRIIGINLGDSIIGGGQGDGVTTHETGTIDLMDGVFHTCDQGGVTCTNTAGTNTVQRVFVENGWQYGIAQAGGGTMRVADSGVVLRDKVGAGPVSFYVTGAGSRLDIYNCSMWGDGTEFQSHVTAETGTTINCFNSVFMRAAAATNQRYVLLNDAGTPANITAAFNNNTYQIGANAWKRNNTLGNFAAWQAAGFDAAGTVVDPLFQIGSGTPFHPSDLRVKRGSPVIAAAVTARPAWANSGTDFFHANRKTAFDRGFHEWRRRHRDIMSGGTSLFGRV